MAARPERLILASGSEVRARLLRDAGVEFSVEAAGIDENPIKLASRSRGDSAEACAVALAFAKAEAVSARHPEDLVIGADQILVAGAAWFDKPPDMAGARRQLLGLRGRTHGLATAVCAVRNGSRLWHDVQKPELTMRQFTDSFLDAYIAAEDTGILGSVGSYRFEGRGVQLFSKVEGSYFTILGLPLIELLDFLRRTSWLNE